MKTFEERFTAWTDGKLTGKELADFERELAGVENAEADKLGAKQLGSLMREHLRAPELTNADFFNHQIMRQIEAAQPSAKETPRRAPASSFFWTLSRMAWAGAACLALATVLYFAAVPRTEKEAGSGQEYVSRVLRADPDVSATEYYSKEENATVLWLDGLDYIPENRSLK